MSEYTTNELIQELLWSEKRDMMIEKCDAIIARLREGEKFEKPKDFPKIVCLCGSTRFTDAFQRALFDETLGGKIVLSIGCNLSNDIIFQTFTRDHLAKIKQELDELHKRKIDLADEVFVLNVGGYVGSSTKGEIKYAIENGKPIRWLEPESAEAILQSIQSLPDGKGEKK